MKTIYNRLKASLLITLLVAAFCSCTKVTELKVKGGNSVQIVIEGNITNTVGAQYVKVSYSIPADETSAPPPVSNAIVTVVDGENKSYAFYESEVAGTYKLNELKTTPGETYTLKVQVNGKTYTASSTMPKINVAVDTMEIVRVDAGKTSYRAMNTFFKDPGDSNNQYRFVMTVNDVKIKTIFVMNNDLIRGKYAYDVLLPYDAILKIGDDVVVDMQCIDKQNYNYWYSLSQQQSSTISALDNSSKSVNPISNFDNNALGYFSAHTSNLKKYKIYGAK